METRPPLLSVLMTAYNREKFIGAAIESVLASNFKDFELIISDDCSTDETVKVAKQFASKDPRIKVFVNQQNLGQFGNRNMSASYAVGKYIKYVDSDDIIYPHTLQVMVDAMLQFPGSALGFCIKYHDSLKPYPYVFSPDQAFRLHYFQQELMMIGPSGLIIKKEVFDEVNGFEEYGMPSDNHLTLKIAGKYPVVALQRDLFWWRKHSDQAFSREETRPESILNNYRFNRDILLNYSPLTGEENKRIARNLKKILYLNLLRLTLNGKRPIRALSLYKEYLKSRKPSC